MPSLLSPATFREGVKRVPTRFGFGEALVEAGRENERVVVLCADLSESTRVSAFQKAFPDRFIQLGVSEQSMAGIAGGLALEGFIPVIASYAAFSPGRNWEQLRLVAAMQNLPIKIIGGHAGISVGPDGATHQMLEDIALMRALPNMTVLAPADTTEAAKATKVALQHPGPVYLRLTRHSSPVFTLPRTPFSIGKATTLREGKDLAIVGCGPLLHEALWAAKFLEADGIQTRVINASSIAPLDERTVVRAAKETGRILVVEEAQIRGGLGSAIAELLAQQHPTPMRFMGMNGFGTSGTAEALYTHFGLDRKAIAKTARAFLEETS